MRIITDFPPNISDIADVFPLRGGEVFAYGDAIYNPGGAPLPPWIVAHEQVHFVQQHDAGGAVAWWGRYLTDPKFRYEQELEAHRVEYKEFCSTTRATRNERRAYLKALARRLSSPMYGSVVTYAEARKAIKRD